jgi:hypothetical protein
MTREEKIRLNDDMRMRVRKLIDDYGSSDGKFADKMDMDRSGFSKRLSGKVIIGKAFINKLVLYFNVDKQWFLTGLGNPYNKDREINSVIESSFTHIPVVPTHIQSDYLKNYKNDDFINSLYSIPEKVDASFKGKYRIFQIEGDAMVDGSQNSILSNDLVLGRDVSLDSVDEKCGSLTLRIFMITYKDGIILRRFRSYNKETREIIFEPLNVLYSDTIIKLNDILELYNVIRIANREI